jgi:spore coat polysaccharide biosynthesis protein SpsF
MKVGYLITGRLKSTRLPKKLLIKVKGKPILSHMIDRLKLAKNVDEIIICTSINKQDKPLGSLAKENNINCFFGDPDDVLVRLLGAADKFNLDYILNITADCPFVDPEYADMMVEEFLETDSDLIRQFDLPHGVFSYGIKVDALRRVVKIKDSSDTEVWGGYFTDTGLFNVIDLEVQNKNHIRPGLRMTLDYPEDLKFFEAVFDALHEKNKIFSLSEILELLDAHPEIIEINKDCGLRFNKRFISQSEPKFKKNIKVKNAIIIGSGSIGQRHISNLKKIGIKNITALRSKKGHYKKLPKDLGVNEIYCWDDALNLEFDIAIISNPTSLHIDAALKISKSVKGIFIEKPLSNNLSGCDQLIDLLNSKKITTFVGHNLMFHPIIKKIIDFYNENDVGEIINIQCQVGQWLPDWHPYENYTKAYYARKDLGGGVSLTLIHEIHLALELAGFPTYVSGEITDYKKLNLDVDVCSDLMIKHKSGAVSQIHLDFLQRPSHRSGLVTFEKAWLSYDFNMMEVTVQKNNEEPFKLYKNSDYDSNSMYIEQLKEFICMVEEERVKHKYDASSSLESLKVVEALFESNLTGRRIDIERNEKFSF